MEHNYYGIWDISIHALREEGDCVRHNHSYQQGLISIHALREEGDRYDQTYQQGLENFYPHPPRGGRRI